MKNLIDVTREALKAAGADTKDSAFLAWWELGWTVGKLPDTHATFEQLEGDTYNPDANKDLSPSMLKYQRRQFRNRVATEGVWGVGLVDPSGEPAFNTWLWGMVGDDWLEDHCHQCVAELSQLWEAWWKPSAQLASDVPPPACQSATVAAILAESERGTVATPLRHRPDNQWVQIPTDLAPFLAVEVHGCVDTEHGVARVSEIHTEREPEFYSVYLVRKEGGGECIADLNRADDAMTIATTLAALFGWEVRSSVKGR